MVIVGISDIHGHIEAIENASEILSKADLVLITGDITHFGRREDAESIIDKVKCYSKQLYAVPGNCDYPEVGSYLSIESISLDGQCAVIDNFAFIGIGGSLPCPGKTPNEYTEEDFAVMMNELKKKIPKDLPCILITHQPPFGTRCDLVRSGEHVGSRALRSFIIEKKPLLCFSGHIHEAHGVDTIGITKVVNPGPLLHGGYALADIAKERVKVSIPVW
ncbi:MAG: metallophosphoesterase [Spirochaetota bacterium]|nr:MAG: metallophosphoesterase [Spirochaetota bacterium]